MFWWLERQVMTVKEAMSLLRCKDRIEAVDPVEFLIEPSRGWIALNLRDI